MISNRLPIRLSVCICYEPARMVWNHSFTWERELYRFYQSSMIPCCWPKNMYVPADCCIVIAALCHSCHRYIIHSHTHRWNVLHQTDWNMALVPGIKMSCVWLASSLRNNSKLQCRPDWKCQSKCTVIIYVTSRIVQDAVCEFASYWFVKIFRALVESENLTSIGSCPEAD